MPRIPLYPNEAMSAEQQAVYANIVNGPRGELVGPLRAALHSPALAESWQALGKLLRFDSSIPPRLRELAILVVGRFWNSDVEWWIHSQAACDAGLSANAIEAIALAKAPALADPLEGAVYTFARELVEFGHVADDAYAAVLNRLGAKGVVELTALVGYYTMVSMTLNAHEIPVPDNDAGFPAWRALSGPKSRPTPLGRLTPKATQR